MTDPRPISYYFDKQLPVSTIYPTFKFVYHFTDNAELRHDEYAVAIPVNWRSRLLEDPALDGIRRDVDFQDVFFIDEGRGWLIIPTRLFALLCKALIAIAADDMLKRLSAPVAKKTTRYMKRKKV